MDQQELFTGLREGLKLLKAGETATFSFRQTLPTVITATKIRLAPMCR